VVLLLAPDTGRTAAFYRETLGLQLQEEQHDGRHSHYACRLGSLYFTIQPPADIGEQVVDRAARGPDSVQLCFTVTDMADFVQHLQELKASPLHPPQPFEHTMFLTLIDPDGRHVRVMTPWQR
jgi:catechol 2,3-dioxygenase-like lactoylglutathione lyase family enzyme